MEGWGRSDSTTTHYLAPVSLLLSGANRVGRVTAVPSLDGEADVPWDQAFDLVARLNGLTWEDDGKAIRVALRAEMR